ncbi:unnamed protein product [Ceutorhynchus assimilis]|uniref:Heat shock protein 70 n=1 Tax=Ceutorhynchus assimilis TaxID=467358 RepID=A0A9N9MJA0_9CUCU|nr:unnamed protein product [Ceutorhynchus assimilis]
MPYAIGIDLGTTFSSVAVIKSGKIPEVIGDSQYGDDSIPSVVFFNPTNDEVSVGKYADQWGIKARTNLIYDVKRLIGRKFDDVYVQDLIKSGQYSFKIVRGREDSAEIEIKQNNRIITKLPEEIAAEILKNLKTSASEFLGEEVKESVISVPAHFNNAQRNATKEAAKLAGLTVLNLISEPVAAAIHYNKDKLDKKSTQLVFDFGGGTLDISVIDIDNGELKVRGIEGDTFLGGRDIDNNIQNELFVRAIQHMKNESNDVKALHLLRVKKKCNKLKIMLSVKSEASVELDYFANQEENSLPLSMSREKFENINQGLFDRAMDLVKLCLMDLKLSAADIDQVVLVGGTTRIPKIRRMLALHFGLSKIKTDINPNLAVVLGAAIQAAMLTSSDKRELEKFKITEVAPLSIGLKLYGGLFQVAIEKNAPLPAIGELKTVTVMNNQKSITTNIYEGERKKCKFNTLLGTYTLNDIPLGVAGSIKFTDIFTLDKNGILTVKTYCQNEKEKEVTVSFSLQEHRSNQSKIRSTLREALRFKEEDSVFEKSIKYWTHARQYCNTIKYNLNKITDNAKRMNIENQCNAFLQYSADAMEDDIRYEDMKKKFDIMEQEVGPLVTGIIDLRSILPKLKN